MSAAERKKLAIIDGKSVFYRGYYAMPNLSTEDGIPTGGVYGFAVMALEVIRRLKPDYVAVAWDKPKTNIRKRLELYPEYKAGRKPAPSDFYDQIPILHELLQAFGWPLYELDDYEADDIMGTLAKQASAKDIETLLVTSDLDMLQVVDPNVHVYALKTGLSNIELYSPVSFNAKYGIDVKQFLDLKALKGDSSDNIPGVPGIGEKTAIGLLKEYKTLDGIYENIDKITGSTRAKLEAGKELAYLSKKLSAIWTDAPIKLNLNEVDGSRADVQALVTLLNKLQFRSLVRQLPPELTTKIANHHSSAVSSFVPKNGNLIKIESDEGLENFLVEDAREVVIHSRAAKPHGGDPEVLILSYDGNKTFALDLKKLNPQSLRQKLTSLPPVIGHNLKATFKVLINLGVKWPPVKHDTLIAAFVLNSLRRELSLTELAHGDLNYQGGSLDELDVSQLIEKAPVITAILKELSDAQTKRINKIEAFPKLLSEIEWPIIPVLAQMEHIGIKLDTNYLSKFNTQIEDMISDVEQEIYGFADEEFNISSPMQLAEVLFERLGLPTTGIKKGKSGYSTAASELDKLRGSHPIIDLITKYREITKLKNTYVDTLPKQADERGRVHTTFNLTIAQTGRLSSTDPNLQNIPTRTELGRKIRTAFIADKGKKLISADYSQFELRLAAVLAKDEGLIDMFNRGADIHLTTAAEVYGRNPEDITKQMRSAAKVVNFGILYGMSPHGLSIATGLTREQAAEFINKFKELRKPLFSYIDEVLKEAHDKGYVETLFGRRRPMPDLNSSNFAIRSAAERAAINMPIQGTEADLMKLAMIKVDEYLAGLHNDCNMLLQIHDSILVECPAEVVEDVSKRVQEIMQDVYSLPVRLDVDVTIGDNWGAL